MITKEFSQEIRTLMKEVIECDLAVTGGGLPGVCAAITAARQGLKVVLVQDRPVLGGNASSEVRLWALGATSHQGNNNRFSREGGVIDEIMVENLWRNPEGNPVLFDMVLVDMVRAEKNITLLLNTTVYALEKEDSRTIATVEAFNAQTSILYSISARLFCDASGDGIVGYLSGASFRVGMEEGEEFGERFAPSEEYRQKLGHSLFFYSRDTGRPVKYTPPDIALKDISCIPRWRDIDAGEHGCRFWWIEYGGNLDTVHDTENIKYELWKAVFGVWDHIKNSGDFPDAGNMTLEWVGLIPGKRESRRFNGLYMINQNDVIRQSRFDDAVAFGGWAIDLHPGEGVYSPSPGCMQYHSKGIYSIPYRCMVSRDIDNLLLAGRIISASRVAFGSTRVMMTSSHCAQATGMAAAICIERGITPAQVAGAEYIDELKSRLAVSGQGIPFFPIPERENAACSSRVAATSSMLLSEIPFDGGWRSLEYSAGQLMPLAEGERYTFELEVDADRATTLEATLCFSSKVENFTPDRVVETIKTDIGKGLQRVRLAFSKPFPHTGYGMLGLERNPDVAVRESLFRMTGLVTVYQKFDKAVAKSATQSPPEGSGIESFDFWVPERRPGGHNLAMTVSPVLDFFGPGNATNGYVRPFIVPNAWVADPLDPHPAISLAWDAPRTLKSVTLFFDTDYDHAMESVQMGHCERVIPFCVRDYTLVDGQGAVLHRSHGNYKTIDRIVFETPVVTDKLTLQMEHPGGGIPASLFEIVVI